MKTGGGNRFWKWSKRCFCGFRIVILLLVLIVATSILYLNEVGLPSFVKKRVVAALEAEGVNLEFSRLRLSGFRHIVVDDMRLGLTNATAPLDFTARKAELNFDS